MEISHWYARELKTGISANMRLFLFLFIILIDSRRVELYLQGFYQFWCKGYLYSMCPEL